MSRILAVVAAGSAFMLAASAQADLPRFAARVGGPDVPALAKFYESAFGLKEVSRLQVPGVLEIFINFGETTAAAKANSDAQIVIMRRAKGLEDPVPHLIFYVSDAKATVEAVMAAGGSMRGQLRRIAQTGDVIGVVIDPAGNLIELIQRGGK
ncbi:MAG TPA: VOC family protein [Steroidobacteraceae bacterium]|nr:VOC family protein [Steroidobacteraceae bacterium]